MRNIVPLVVHVADGETGDGRVMLQRTARAIEGLGLEQRVLQLDNRDAFPCAGLAPAGKWRLLQHTLLKAAPQRPLYAVHFHGLQACLLGASALKETPPCSRVLFSPHLCSAASRWQAALASRRLRPGLIPFDRAAITASPAEAGLLAKSVGRSPEVVPYPVAGAFFEAQRAEQERASILAAGTGSAAADAASRLSVLLNGRAARVPIAWLGRPPAGTHRQLGAAGVPVLAAETELQAAQALACAAVFIHFAPAQHDPLPVAQAMACGVPCLVSDTPEHRWLVRHGETGFVCSSERELIERLIPLLRDRRERRRMGEAARADAERCFSVAHFERAIRRVYGLTSEVTLVH